jgi:hypothetical protein
MGSISSTSGPSSHNYPSSALVPIPCIYPIGFTELDPHGIVRLNISERMSASYESKVSAQDRHLQGAPVSPGSWVLAAQPLCSPGFR